MTVGELVDRLNDFDRARFVYVPDCDGKAELAVAVVGLQHENLGDDMQGISIPNDVAIIPLSLIDTLEDELMK